MRKIYTYYNGTNSPVNEFIKNAEEKIKKKLKFCVDYIRDDKHCFCEPYVRHMSIKKYKQLYELRIKSAGTMVRIIFCEYNTDIYLLYAFYKKDRKDTEKALEAGHKILEYITDKDGEISEEHRRELVIDD